jgi:hypothetical protein
MAILVYALVGSVLFILQDHLLFHPEAIDQDSSYQFNQPFQESVIPLDASTKFHVVHFTVPDSVKERSGFVFSWEQKKYWSLCPVCKKFHAQSL